MVGAFHRLILWEYEHLGTSTDTAALIEDVALCLQAITPSVELKRSPSLSGLSRQTHTFDFSQGDTLIAAIPPHHASVGGLLRKLIDVKGSPHNQSYETLVIVDDRKNKEAADRETSVLSGVSPVMLMSNLVERSMQSKQMH